MSNVRMRRRVHYEQPTSRACLLGMELSNIFHNPRQIQEILSRKAEGMSERRPQQAVALSSRLADAIYLLSIHGMISEAERDRAYKRLDVWVQTRGLKRKGQP